MRIGIVIVAAACLGASVPAQTSWLVGGSSTALNQTLGLANDGDELVVQPGVYYTANFDKSVTIRAQIPGTVDVQTFGMHANLDAGKVARLSGLRIVSVALAPATTVTAGSIAFEDCEFYGAEPVKLTRGFAHFERCTLTAAAFWGFPALQSDGATISMVDCQLRGSSSQVGHPTVDLRNGSVLLGSKLAVNVGLATVWRAMTVDATSRARVTDSTFACLTGCAIVGADVVLERCTVTGTCPAFSGEPLLGIVGSGPITIGQPYTVTVQGEPGLPTLLVGAYGPGLGASPLLSQPLLLDPSLSFVAGAAVNDASGRASFTFQIQNTLLPFAAAFWLQGISGASLPLAASPLVGGLAH